MRAVLQQSAVWSNHSLQGSHHVSLYALFCAAALQLNLARALTRAGSSSEALQLYEELEGTAGAVAAGGRQHASLSRLFHP
jgi:hypothetical protein